MGDLGTRGPRELPLVVRAMRPWSRLPREAADAPPLEMRKAWSNLVGLVEDVPMAGGGLGDL